MNRSRKSIALVGWLIVALSWSPSWPTLARAGTPSADIINALRDSASHQLACARGSCYA